MVSNFRNCIFAATIQLSIILTTSTLSFAQDTTDSNVFIPAFFENYAPRTALDMVTRVPGFQIQLAD